MSLKKPQTKSGVYISPLLHFRKPEFFHTFSVIPQHKKYRKCMEDVKFSKKDKELLCTPHLVYKLKFNYDQTIKTQTSRIRIVDLIAASVDTESEKLLYLKLQVFLWSLLSSIPSPAYLQSWELYCWQCASINTKRKETNPLRGM